MAYKITDLDLKSGDTNIKLEQLTVNIDFLRLLSKKIVINNITVKGTSFNIDIPNTPQKVKKTEFNYKKAIIETQNIISKALENNFIIKNFTLKDFKINFISKDNKNIPLNIRNLTFNINIQNDNLIINQETTFNINNNKIDSKLITTCENQIKNKKCNINISNVNLNDYLAFLDKKGRAYDYFSNIKALFDLDLNFILNENLEFENGNLTLLSKLGSFNLKQFFDEKIIFIDLVAEAEFKDNFKEININSIKTFFGKTDFFMSMFIKDKETYKNVDLNFNVKNLPIKNLKQLWPNFLGQKEEIRPWVIKHITDGESPNAWAKMNMKYFKQKSKQKDSGLQNIHAEVQMKNVLLNYDDYFPTVKNINGTAIFTEKNMNINIDSANILSTKTTKGNIFMDFDDNIDLLKIKANTRGPISDLFVHIDKDSQKIIEAKVDDIVEDKYTTSQINIDVPIVDNIDFNKVYINISSNILNKPNYILKNSSNIFLTFTKPKDANNFFGTINLTNTNVEFLPLNLYKPAKKELKFDYGALLDDNIVYITKLNPTVDYLKFNIDGILDIKNNLQEVNAENIRYNGSNYNIHYKSFVKNNTVYNNINIFGNNINYENIVEKIRNTALSITQSKNTEDKNNINIEDNIVLGVNYFSFENDKKLLSPYISIKIKNNKLELANFSANMTDKKFIKLKLDKDKKMFNISSNDFGKLFDTINLTNNVKNGSGEININQKNIKGKDVIVGNLKITENFSIIPDDDVKKEVLTDVKQDKNFKKLEKGLKKKNGITFDKLRGEFTYSDNILSLKEVVANSDFINLQVLLSGFINIKTGEIEMNGLLVPLDLINGLFGVNKLPVIGELIFGQKDAGLFASRFSITKKDNNSKMDININKFSMILPGFLRNIFSRSTPIKTVNEG